MYEIWWIEKYGEKESYTPSLRAFHNEELAIKTAALTVRPMKKDGFAIVKDCEIICKFRLEKGA